MSRWENITSSLKKGVSFIEHKSKEILAVTQLSNELNRLNKEKATKAQELGEMVYQLSKEGKLHNEETDEILKAIADYDRKIEEKKEEIEKARKAAEEEEKVKEEEKDGTCRQELETDCGHEIPEGAKFCPTCGRKIED